MSKRKDKKIEIREIVYSGEDEKSFGDIFVYEPENIEEQKLGNLFIVGELKDLPRNSSYIVNLLASKIKKEFYSNTKRTTEESLEAGLAAANQMLSDLADQGNGEYVGKMSMVCGTYRGGKFYMSQVGKIKSLLVRDGQLVEIIKEDEKAASPKRAFNNIASGELSDGDMVMFATPGLFNIFSLEKIRKMASSMTLDEFAAKVQEEIEEEDSEVVSALVLEINGDKPKEALGRSEVKLEPEELETAVEEPTLVEEESMSQLADEAVVEEEDEAEVADEEPELPEEKAEEEENEPVVPAKPKKQKEVAKAAAIEPIPIEAEIEAEEVAAGIEKAAQPISSEAEDLLRGKNNVSLSDIIKEYEKLENKPANDDLEKDENIKNIVSKKNDNDFEDLDEKKGGGFVKTVAEKTRSSLRRVKSEETKAYLAALTKRLSSGKKEYKVRGEDKNLQRITGKKIALVIVAVIVFVFVLSPVLFKNNKGKTDMAATYQAMLTDAQTKIDQADMDIVSGTSQDSGKLFLDAKTLALKVKSEYSPLSTQADTIIAKAQTEIDRADKVTRIQNLETIAALDNGNMSQLVDMVGSFYVVDGKENAIYKVDAKNKTVAQVAKATDKIGDIRFAQNFQNQEIVLSDGSAFSSFGLKSLAVTKLSGTLDGGVKDFVAYSKNLYLLSPAKNQIYKYQKTAQGLGAKVDWLKSGDISNAVSIAIDQSVYLLTGDGQVKKYYAGEEAVTGGKKFTIEQPSDTIAGATKIFTLLDQKYLYVLDAGKSRVLIYDKTSGALLKQLMGEGFADIKDISVDAKETTLTLLMKDKLAKISL